jgi:hypothetical protein
MKDAVRTVEGTPALRPIDGKGHGSRPASPASSEGSTMPHRVYSLDGLMALALAVQQLEVAE